MLLTKKIMSDLPWKLLSVEAILVVSSVLLALALEDWQQSRAEARLADRALQEFVDEVHTNCSRIMAVQAYHQRVAGGESEPEGIQIGLLRNDAWDVAKTTGAVPHMEYDVVARVTEISAHQGDHRAIVQAYIQALFGRALEFEGKLEWHQEGERGVVRELSSIQSELLRKYQGLLDLLDQEYAHSVNTDGACRSGQPQ